MIKKFKLFLILLVNCSFTAHSQHNNTALIKADSLFMHQKFIQSFDIYDSIYDNQMATPAMLLKMSYIKEGLGDYSSAQYYLNEYYLATNNDLALTKMEELAKEKELLGYETNDLNFIINLYYKHFKWLTLGVLTIALLLFMFFLIQLFKFKSVPPITTFFLASTLIGLTILINFGKSYNKGIITKNNAFVMAAPSAGANVIDVIGKGNKVVIENKTDVWLQIEWKEQKGYIKNNNVRLLTIW